MHIIKKMYDDPIKTISLTFGLTCLVIVSLYLLALLGV